MNNKLVLWLGVLALTAAPAVRVMAQEGPGEDAPEAGMPEEGRGKPDLPGGPGLERPGMELKGGPGYEPGRKKTRGGPGMGGHFFLSEDETLALIKKHDPVFGKKMAEMKTIAPVKYRIVLQMGDKILSMARMEQDESMEKDAVRGIVLEFDTKELAQQYGRAAEADKKAVKETLRAKLGELFDLKNKGQELRVAHMEKEIGKLKKNLESRKINKAKIVEQRLEQVTGEGLGW